MPQPGQLEGRLAVNVGRTRSTASDTRCGTLEGCFSSASDSVATDTDGRARLFHRRRAPDQAVEHLSDHVVLHAVRLPFASSASWMQRAARNACSP